MTSLLGLCTALICTDAVVPCSNPTRWLVNALTPAWFKSWLANALSLALLGSWLANAILCSTFQSGHYSRQNLPSITYPILSSLQYWSHPILNIVIMVYHLLIWLIISLVCLLADYLNRSPQISPCQKKFPFPLPKHILRLYFHICFNATFIPAKLLILQLCD